MAPILLVATILTASITIILSMVGMGRWAGYFFPHWWARLFCALTFVRVTVVGRENIDSGTSYVFVANHQGAYDIFSIYGYLNHQFRWMMKKALEKIPLVGYSCKVSGHIMVDNSTPASTRETLEKAEKQLQGGMSLVVFPEGARTWDGKMRPFKRGAYRLAVEFGLPVVPITINGAFDVMPRFKKIPIYGHITLTIHKPIEAVDGIHDLPLLMNESFEAILSSLDSKYA
ncbi:MAG: 1-acyl-sn-glycerol-3-phosphate acyltransferase [Bacteroides sp.]|nr:1-acyl-sn-glycerol-3-phosphate acyltransferase [Bacteroides sp.]MCM1389550.1 1-acyl-sn-glycerol-3-phosphate acyltransferase [Bacteroides sp.]